MIWGSADNSQLREARDQIFRDLWAETYAWESAAADEYDLWLKESDQNRELIDRASLTAYNGSAAFELHLEGAESGSVWCQQAVGWHYWTGSGVVTNKYLAMQYYYSASCSGSWTATLCYARLLYEVGRFDDCERVLNDGVSCGFAPSYYWLAWLRHKRHSTRAVRKEVRPLVEHAAKEGHPAAMELLTRWMVSGKLRLRDIPRGWLMVIQYAIVQANREAKEKSITARN
jgi:TPR repeat protein